MNIIKVELLPIKPHNGLMAFACVEIITNSTLAQSVYTKDEMVWAIESHTLLKSERLESKQFSIP